MADSGDKRARHKPTSQKRRGFGNAQKRAHARQITGRLEWLSDIPVYMSGSPADDVFALNQVYRPIRKVLSRALRGINPGLYALGLRYPDEGPFEIDDIEGIDFFNPRVVSRVPVTAQRIGDALSALAAARRFPRALPPLVGDVKRWRQQQRARLNRLADVARAAALIGTSDPASLGVEATALWLGPTATRPSHRLQTAALTWWMQPHLGGKRAAALAAVVLGQRGRSGDVPLALRAWARLGAALASWPPDIICLSWSDAAEAGRAATELASDPVAGCEEAAQAMAEHWVARGGRVAAPSPMSALLPVLRTAEAVDLGARDARPRRTSRRGCRRALAGLWGRLSGRGEVARAGPALCRWLEICWDAACQGKGDIRPLEAGLSVLERGLASATRQGMDWTRLVERLAALGPTMWRWTASAEDRECGDAAFLLSLPNLDDEAVRHVLEVDLLWAHELLAGEGPDAFASFLTWSRAAGRTLKDCRRRHVRLVVRLPPEMRDLLAAWSQQRERGLCDALDFLDPALPGAPARAAFLRENSWVLDRLEDCPLFPRALYMELCRCWLQRWGSGLSDLLDGAAARWRDTAPTFYHEADSIAVIFEEAQVAVELAGEDPQRLPEILERLATGYGSTVDPPPRHLPGWCCLDDDPELQILLRQSASRPELLTRVLQALADLSDVVRLQRRDLVRRELRDCLQDIRLPSSVDTTHVPDELRRPLARVLAFRRAASLPEAPKAIRKIVNRPESIRAQVKALTEKASQGRGSEKRRQRLSKLEGGLARPELFGAWIARDLRRAVAQQLRQTALAALEQIVARALRDHWLQRMGGQRVDDSDPDWANAFRLDRTVRQNRRTLQKLLGALARGDGGYVLRRTENVAFLEKVRQRGIRTDAWLNPPVRAVTVCGETYKVYAERDPLRVLQMGNLFGSCLSVGKYSAYSTIANAVEINKHVIYVADGEGHIIGRRLIAMDEEGMLHGFKLYGVDKCRRPLSSRPGEDPVPWIPLLCGLYCALLARRTGCRLVERWEATPRLSLGLEWYTFWMDDRGEFGRGWLTELAHGDSGGDPFTDPDIRLCAMEMLAEMKRLSSIFPYSHPSDDLLQLIFIGECALPLLLTRSWTLGKTSVTEALDYVARHGRTRALRKEAKRLQWDQLLTLNNAVATLARARATEQNQPLDVMEVAREFYGKLLPELTNLSDDVRELRLDRARVEMYSHAEAIYQRILEEDNQAGLEECLAGVREDLAELNKQIAKQHLWRDEFAAAVEHYERAARLYETVGASQDQRYCLADLISVLVDQGGAHWEQNRRDAALEAWGQVCARCRGGTGYLAECDLRYLLDHLYVLEDAPEVTALELASPLFEVCSKSTASNLATVTPTSNTD